MLNDLSRVYACSYLTQGPSLGYLRRPLQPNPPKSPNFHQPPHHERKVYGRIHINKQGWYAKAIKLLLLLAEIALNSYTKPFSY